MFFYVLCKRVTSLSHNEEKEKMKVFVHDLKAKGVERERTNKEEEVTEKLNKLVYGVF